MQDPESRILWGAEAIAREIGRPVRATFHLLEAGELPARKVGGRWAVDRDVLIAFFRGETITTDDYE